MRIASAVLLGLVTFHLTLSLPALAEGQTPSGRSTLRPQRTDVPPVIDGHLTDETWTGATTITAFVQSTPVEGSPATEATDVFVAYDADNLYFGFHAHYADVQLVRAYRVERDETERDDTITVYLDTSMDQERAYGFSVNGYGVQGDTLVGLNDKYDPGGVPTGNLSWDALFSSAGVLVADGWTAEMAIPFKSLRYPPKGETEIHRWGFQVVRLIRSKDEIAVASPVTRRVFGFLTQMGVLEGLTGLSTSRNLELLSTFTGIQARTLNSRHGAFDTDGVSEAALNLKYGITSSLTADFTVNPDFSQIESDQPQIEVNQRFPLFFEELRPFFLEGQEVFNFVSSVDVVHTRTIVDPRFGAKLSGQIGRTTVALLVADDESPGKRVNPGTPGHGKVANVAIGRVRYDLYPESHVGTLVTNREFMDTYSRVAGIDAQLRFSGTGRYNFVGFRSTHRDAAGIEREGLAFGHRYAHNGRNLTFSIFAGTTDPNFRTDTGFLRRVDTRRTNNRISYRWWPEGRLINWGPSFNYQRNYNYDGVLEDEVFGTGLDFTFARNVRFGVGAERAMERFRGVDFWKWQQTATFNIAASRRFTVSGDARWGDQVRFIATPFLGRSTGGSLSANLRPVSRLQSQVSVALSRLLDPRTDGEVFDIKIFRALTTYQFTERLLLRNIMEYNTFARTLAANVLVTYRVNSGTVFFIGYDDHYQQGDLIDSQRYPTTAFQQTNRAVFTKFSYLFRYRY